MSKPIGKPVGQAIHVTNRYGKKGKPADPNIAKRHQIDALVAAGRASIGQIKSNSLNGGLAQVARMVRLGHWKVFGFSVGNLAGVEKINAQQRRKLVDALGQLPPNTKIIEISSPDHWTEMV